MKNTRSIAIRDRESMRALSTECPLPSACVILYCYWNWHTTMWAGDSKRDCSHTLSFKSYKFYIPF